MMGEKPFSTFDEQIEILESRGLLFGDVENAKNKLIHYSYYEIINGYKDFLLDPSSPDEDKFLPNSTFERLYSLYEMDKSISSSVMESTKEIELTLRTAVAHVIAESFGEKTSDYLNRNNYQAGPKNYSDSGYKIDQILKKLANIANDDVQPMKHYREQHGNVPPWIVLKGTTFGNLTNLYKLQKEPQKNRIISLVFGIPEELISLEIKTMFIDIIFLCLSFRNRAAHGGRMYNYHAKTAQIKYSELFHKRMKISKAEYHRQNKGRSDLYTLFSAFTWFDNVIPRAMLEFDINYYVNRHCSKHPTDRIILQEMGFPENYNFE